MEEDFIVRTHREGTAKVTTDMELTISSMGCTCFNNRDLGRVTIIVERERGVIIKEKIKWGKDNDSKFDETMSNDAKTLLEQSIKAVEGGGDDDDVRIKIVAKK